jgi:hypothetical protein
VREKARRDGLEQHQGGPGDHQHVEDEPRRRRALGRPDDQRSGVQQALLADHDQQYRRSEPAPVRQRELRGAGCGPGLRRRGSTARDRAAGECQRHDGEAQQRRRHDPERDRRLPVRDADGDSERERHPGRRLGQEQRPVEDEPPAAGEKSPGEEARAERKDGTDQDPVQSRVTREQVVLKRPAQRERDGGEREREPELDGGADPQRQARDRAGQQLLDRPKEDRDRHEDGRPVGGEGEVDVGQ